MKEAESMEQALVLYIDTVRFGLECAFTVLGDMERGQLRPPKPASGQRLCIDGNELDCHLCASPIPGANAIAHHHHHHHNKPGSIWKISQGELFAGILNVRETINTCKGQHLVDFLGYAQDQMEHSQVLVKVSSRAVHGLLVDPSAAYMVLRCIPHFNPANDLPRHMALEKARLEEAHATLQNEISSVLVAAVRMNAGMVTIMRDLSAEGYQALKPKYHPNKLRSLWAGFSNLVNHVLVPMANMCFIHADIRPGYDETANILCRFESDGRASLKLIDFESVVEIKDWKAPLSGSYIKRQNGWTATTFVWWQCVAVAYAWVRKVSAKTLFEEKQDNALVGRLRVALEGRLQDPLLVPLLPNEFLQYVDDTHITEEVITKTLAELAHHFL
jgi:hypothetical protein